MKIIEIVNAYKILGEVQVYNLADEEVIKIINARIEMKQYVDKYNTFLEEAKEKCKPSDYNEKSVLIQDWANQNESIKNELNVWLRNYNNKINAVIKDFTEQTVELNIEKLSKDTAVKLLKANSWQPNKLDDISFILCQETN